MPIGYSSPDGKFKEFKAKTTLVCFHDLLGFGEMVALSGGSLDSAVGELCLRRIEALRKNVGIAEPEFPSGTKLFQMNDSAVAVCDIDHYISRNHLQKPGVSSNKPDREIFIKVVQFLIASAEMHTRTEFEEERTRIGPAGRTIVVAGHRWPISLAQSDKVADVPELQANLAFSEAYLVDSQGSSIGLKGLSMYMNDLMYWLLKLGSEQSPDIASKLSNSVDVRGMPFPDLTQFGQGPSVTATIFHKKVEYLELHSHVIARLRNSINEIAINK
jgi:hypothetical protein